MADRAGAGGEDGAVAGLLRPADERAAGLLRGPVGCCLLLVARHEGLGAAELADPLTACELAAAVCSELNPWRDAAPEARAECLARAGEVADLAAQVAGDPRCAWWWQTGPLGPQLHLAADVDPREAAWRAALTSEAKTGAEAYAQRPVDGLLTATRLPSPAPLDLPSASSPPYLASPSSPLHLAYAYRVGDLDPRPGPLRQEELHPAPGAAVYPINAPEDWHALAARFPVRIPVDSLPDGVNVTLSPDWAGVGEVYDGVHLSLAGLLSALFVPVSGPGGTTTLWSWECAQTWWLREAFTARRELPPVDPDVLSGDLRWARLPIELATDRAGTPLQAFPPRRRWARWGRRGRRGRRGPREGS